MANIFYESGKGLSNLFSNLFIGGKDRFTQTPIMQQRGAFLGNNTPEWVTITGKEAEIFNTTASLQTIICRLASMYGNGQYKHYKIKSNGEYDEIKNSPYVNLLENPNPLQSKEECQAEDYINQCIFGNSFQYLLKSGFFKDEVPGVIWNLPANFMQVVPTGKLYQQVKIEDIIEKYILNINGKEEFFSPLDVMHFKNTDPLNPIIGISPLLGLQMHISNLRGALGYRNVLITERGAIGVLSNRSKDGDGGIPLSGPEREKITNQFKKDYGVRENQDKVIITSSTLDWQPFNFPTQQLMLFEEENAGNIAIMDRFGAKKELFSDMKGATFSNAEEAKKTVYQDTIIPFASNRTFALTKKFDLIKKGEFIDLDYSHLECMQKNQKDLANILNQKANAYSKLKDTENFTPEQLSDIIQF